ncbi:MAG: hypothetical protein P4M14_00710 [Gammaproteobacteria bacterium]|nr:hypothetical protein [Gammaproteobacteria bacterium]
MKAKLLIIISCIALLTGCCTNSSCGCNGGGCETYYSQPTCSDTGSCWDDDCGGSRCAHVFDNAGSDGNPSACYTDYYTR